MKKANKKACKWLKKTSFLGTGNFQIIDYNNDMTLDDLETVDFNNDTQMTDSTDIDKIDLKKTSATQQAIKKIIKKYRNLKKEDEPINYNGLNKEKQTEIMTLCLLNRSS